MIDRQEWKEASELLPLQGEEVICRSAACQALGYRDHTGQWRFHDGSPFPNVRCWQPLRMAFRDVPISRELKVSQFCTGTELRLSFNTQ